MEKLQELNQKKREILEKIIMNAKDQLKELEEQERVAKFKRYGKKIL